MSDHIPGPGRTSSHDAAHTGDYIARERKYLAQIYKPLSIVLNRGEGVWLWDTQGKKYLDFLSAYSAVSFGHLNPRIKQAVLDQLDLLDVPARAFHTDRLGEFALIQVARHRLDPGGGNANDWLGEILVSKANRLQHRARWCAIRSVGHGGGVPLRRIARAVVRVLAHRGAFGCRVLIVPGCAVSCASILPLWVRM